MAGKAASTGETQSSACHVNPSSEIGSRIASLRKDLDMTQRQLAEKLGLTVTTVANWENGRRGLEWLVTAKKLCNSLNCSLDDLVEVEEDEDDYPSYDELIELFKASKLG